MRYFSAKYVLILIFILQTGYVFCEVDSSFKNYNGAIISTLSLGLSLQAAGIAFLMYSNSYFLSDVSPLQIEDNLPSSSDNKQLKNKLKEKRDIYNNYFISSIAVFSVGTVSTIVGLGLILSRAIHDWKKTDTKSTFNKKAYKQLINISSIQFSPNVTLSMYSLYPTAIMFSIQ